MPERKLRGMQDAMRAAAGGGPASLGEIDWKEWWRAVGAQQRHIREFLGLSQEQLARLAGVSQGAVSRLEAGRALATPLLVVLKIALVQRRALETIDQTLLSADLRRCLELDRLLTVPIDGIGFRALPISEDQGLEELIRLYRSLPDRQRQVLASVVRATAASLAGAGPAAAAAKA